MPRGKVAIDIKCPITGGILKYEGTQKYVMDPTSYYVSRGKGGKVYRFARHPFSWKRFVLFEIDGKKVDERTFELADDYSWTELFKVKNVGFVTTDIPASTLTWLIIKGWAKAKWRKIKYWWKYHVLKKQSPFPRIKHVHAKTIAQDFISVQPMAAPMGTKFFMDYTNKEINTYSMLDTNRKPNISKEEEPLMEHVKGHVYTITKENLSEARKNFRTDNIEIGDEVYLWDMGGWQGLAGREGEIVVRNDTDHVASRLTKLS